jgi:hypothetical protein
VRASGPPDVIGPPTQKTSGVLFHFNLNTILFFVIYNTIYIVFLTKILGIHLDTMTLV